MDLATLIISNHTELVKKVDKGFADIQGSAAEHELKDETRFGQMDKRLSFVESTNMLARWFIGAAILAVMGAAAEHLFNHSSKAEADHAPVPRSEQQRSDVGPSNRGPIR